MSVKKNFRTGDHQTSVAAAQSVTPVARSLRLKLLEAYRARPLGLTDDGAATLMDLTDTCYWKRCGELRDDGLIEIAYTDKGVVTKMASKGRQRMLRGSR